ncbi:DUF4192 domain-containing protein [Amycolatopsis sp. NPDC047767]|uniref:DUF4192 domain-containing protein n=1 Tax=Amycolatopsis sp. NPDC047767 TaxID=3156765 RepID=UPI003451F575
MEPIDLKDESTLIASIPLILGFHPSESIILVSAIVHPSGQTRLGPVARMDLRHFAPYPGNATPQLLEVVEGVKVARLQGVIVTGAKFDEPDLPLHLQVETFEDLCAKAGHSRVRVVHVPSFAPGQPWRGYCHDACSGTLPDVSGSELAAVNAHNGRRIFGSIQEVAQDFEPGPADVRMRLAQAVRDIATAVREEANRQDLPALGRRLQRVDSAVAAVESGNLPKTDTQIADLIGAFGSIDVAMAAVVPRRGDDDIVATQNLLHHLLRVAPSDDGAAIAGALAVTYFLCGDNTRARLAVESTSEASILGHLMSLALKGTRSRDTAAGFLIDESIRRRGSLTGGLS